MESHVKLLGHPIHPMLIVLPLGLLSTTVLFDVVYLVTGDETFAQVAFWTLTVGLIGGLLAAIFGLIDWMNIPDGTRAKTIGLYHGVGNLVIVLLFVGSWLFRLQDHAYAPDVLPFVLGLVGVGLALGTAWLGGELVYRLRVGVDDGAHLDAPTSLSGEPATGTDRDTARTAG
ncbi:MAG: DUF2231 domain-containing protein [Chloroflexota bacterium]